MEQRLALYAQADLRETRTRRQTRKPDYVYNIQDLDSDVSNTLVPGSSSADLLFVLERWRRV